MASSSSLRRSRVAQIKAGGDSLLPLHDASSYSKLRLSAHLRSKSVTDRLSFVQRYVTPRRLRWLLRLALLILAAVLSFLLLLRLNPRLKQTVEDAIHTTSEDLGLKRDHHLRLELPKALLGRIWAYEIASGRHPSVHVVPPTLLRADAIAMDIRNPAISHELPPSKAFVGDVICELSIPAEQLHSPSSIPVGYGPICQYLYRAVREMFDQSNMPSLIWTEYCSTALSRLANTSRTACKYSAQAQASMTPCRNPAHFTIILTSFGIVNSVTHRH